MIKTIKKNPKTILVKKVQAKKIVLDPKLKNKINEIREVLKLDGGDLKVVGFEKNVLSIELLGVCTHCPMAEMTISGFIQGELEKIVPKIKIKRA